MYISYNGFENSRISSVIAINGDKQAKTKSNKRSAVISGIIQVSRYFDQLS